MRIVIMGGTSGIGLATAELLAATGAEVTVTGRDQGHLDAVPAPIDAVALDGTDGEAVTAWLAGAGPLDHLVLALSPGAVGAGPLRSVEPDAVQAAFAGKLFAYLHAIRTAEVTGSITMVSAASARAAVAGTVVLAAVNGAVERIVPPLAAELAPVRVNAVSPGVVDTPWWSWLPEEERQAQFAAASGSVPAGRVGTAGDVADAVAFLIGATFVTGTILPVDGGYTVA